MRPKKSIRYQSSFKICGYPLIDIACGPDNLTNQSPGFALGVIAIGLVAKGGAAIGYYAFRS